MDGPSESLRSELSYEFEGMESENDLEEILARIEGALLADIESNGLRDQAPDDLLAAIESWAGLASAAIARFFAPASPWPRSVAGWGRRAVGRLRRIANALVPPL